MRPAGVKTAQHSPGLPPPPRSLRTDVINLYAAEICSGLCPMRWKRLVRREDLRSPFGATISGQALAVDGDQHVLP
jgi:hypothetical protein